MLIPEGDYNNKKLIMGKQVGKTDSPYIWVDPMDSFANITSNILDGAKDFTEDGLVANFSSPKNIFSGNQIPLTFDDKGQPLIDTSALTIADGDNITAVDLAGYTRIGISAKFKTNFGVNTPIGGNYGLLFIAHTVKETGADGQQITEDIPIWLDSSNMWGNPYQYGEYITQSTYFDIDPAKNGKITAIDGYFYQNFQFVDEKALIPYDEDFPNIFVKDINVSLGYAVDKVEDDTIFLFTENSNIYKVDNETRNKTLQTRFIYVGEDNTTRFAINGESDLQSKLIESDSFASLMPIIRWYRYSLTEGVSDLRAGDFWQEFYPNSQFIANINDLTDSYKETFKCILCYNNKANYYLQSYIAKLPDGDLKTYYNNLKTANNIPDYSGTLSDGTLEEIWEQ